MTAPVGGSVQPSACAARVAGCSDLPDIGTCPRMMNPDRRNVLALLAVLAASLAARPAAAQLQTFATSQLTIDSAAGRHRFMVELALTPAQMEQGLMFRRHLAPDAGMLFDYRVPTVATMWMENT